MSYIQNVYPILSRDAIARDVFDFVVHCPEMASQAQPGQFVHIRAAGHTLRRPISICEIDREKGTLRLVFEVRGSGTEMLSMLPAGGLMDLLGPLGNGFTMLPADRSAIVVGGGIGTPPLLEVAKHYAENGTAILGFRNAAHVILDEDFDACGCDLRLATDDGSRGHHGFVTDLLRQRLAEGNADIIYACGPKGMLQAVAALAEEFGVRCELSLEERMACGVGACLGCATPIRTPDGGMTYKHVCKDGPVFDAKEVIF